MVLYLSSYGGCYNVPVCVHDVISSSQRKVRLCKKFVLIFSCKGQWRPIARKFCWDNCSWRWDGIVFKLAGVNRAIYRVVISSEACLRAASELWKFLSWMEYLKADIGKT